MVDGLGGLGDAIAEARKLAGLGARRDVEVAVFSAQGDVDLLPLSGRGLIRARGGESLGESLKREIERLSALSKADLWAFDPGLAGLAEPAEP